MKYAKERKIYALVSVRWCMKAIPYSIVPNSKHITVLQRHALCRFARNCHETRYTAKMFIGLKPEWYEVSND